MYIYDYYYYYYYYYNKCFFGKRLSETSKKIKIKSSRRSYKQSQFEIKNIVRALQC